MRGDRGPGPYLNLLSEIGDRTEGRPIQVTQSYSKRTTIFEKGEGQAGANPGVLTASEKVAVTTEIISPLDGHTKLYELGT